MTSSNRLATIQSIYNKRAPTYDSEEGFHPAQAADYLKWMNLAPGLSVLDLACGTGAIAIPAARAVGPSGQVIGVDISDESLTVAKSKVGREGLNAKFIQHDIAALHEVKEIEEEAFEVITCVSAFVLLENAESVVKGWAKLLKSGGRIIFDVPAKHSMLGGYLLDTVGKELGFQMVYDQTRHDSAEKVEELLNSAGLDPSECFESGVYRETELDARNAGDVFEGLVGRKEWFEGAYSGFDDPAIKGIAKEMFCTKMEALADSDGKIKELMKFNMAVGRKI